MKLSVLQENLARGLSLVGRAVATRGTLSILGNILLASDQGRLKLAATNLEIGLQCWIGADIQDDGAITIPARLLVEFVNTLPPEKIDIELATRTHTLHLHCTSYEANIKGIDAQEFPLLPEAGEERPITMTAGSLKTMIQQVVFAAATDESRPILTGVLTEFQDGALTMAAADGFRLSLRQGKLIHGAQQPVSVIIPARALQELARIIEEGDDEIEISLTPQRNQVVFRLTDRQLVSQLIEGTFPNYRQIIPPSSATRTVVRTDALLKATRLASLFARDSANIVRLDISSQEGGGSVKLSATAAELGDNEGLLEAEVDGENLEIAFNAKYLLDFLNVASTQHVVIETSSASSPGLLRPQGGDGQEFLCVIMPMHLAR